MKYLRDIPFNISSTKVDLIIITFSILALCGLLAVGYDLIQIEPASPVAPAANKIVFATVTPGPKLYENQRFRPAPPPAEMTPPQRAAFAGANELGQIMVLEYHRIASPERRYQRTPANFQADLQRLYAGGYYPVNFIDLINKLSTVPAGKKPVVLTFDDSDISQFRLLDDNTIDVNSAVGVILNFHSQYPTEWPTRATFFVLGDDTGDYISIFGQPQWSKAKAQFLVKQGMELGSHTVNHTDLSVATAERIYWELAISKQVIEELAPGYTVQTLSVPYGGFPYTLEFLETGEWGGYSYHYLGNAAAWGGPSPSPFAETFDSYRVPRVEVTADSFDYWLTYFEQHPHDYYISDGDPTVVAAPTREIAAE